MADNTSNRSEESENEEVDRKKQEIIPDAVDHFLGLLEQALKTRNIPEIHKLYEDTFNKLTEKHYKVADKVYKKWPDPENVKTQISGDPLFLVFYKELYYRHIYSRFAGAITFDQRKGSWENYCKLLELVIDDLESEGEELSLALPPQLIWDILDEFVYHYQVFTQHKNKAKKVQKDSDIQLLKDNPEVFDTPQVLDYLHRLVRASKIDEYLVDPSNQKGVTGKAFKDETTRLFGYYGLMQLLRMHSLLGDYQMAMQTLKNIDFDEEVPLFYKIPACHVTLYYYMGFAYMMLRRYTDASRTFCDILVFLQKTSGVNTLSYQYDQMAKKRDQMYALLLLCLSLCPQNIDESLDKDIKEKHGEKLARLRNGDNDAFRTFEDLFSYACPKFVTASLPDLSNEADFDQTEAHRRQKELFVKEVKEQALLPRIGAYMKLYTAISTAKLAQLCDMDEEGLRDTLMSVIHKSHQRVRQKGAPCAGDFQVCSEVEFHLDGDMVHINAQKTERPHTEVFMEQILKFNDLLKKMGK